MPTNKPFIDEAMKRLDNYQPVPREQLVDEIELLREQLDVANKALCELKDCENFDVHLTAQKALDKMHIIQRSKYHKN